MSLQAGGPLLLAALSFDPVSIELCLGPVEDGARRSLARDETSEAEFILQEQSEPPPPRQRDVRTHDWLKHLYSLGSQGEIHGAVYLVLDTLDDLLFWRNESRIVEILEAAEVDRLQPEILLALLAATLRARSALGVPRERFYHRVEEMLQRDAPGEVEALLDGLG